MAKFRCQVTVKDTRNRAKRVEGIVDRETRHLRAELKDFFRSLKGKADGDELQVKVVLTERVFLNVPILRTCRERYELRVHGVFAGEPFEFANRQPLRTYFGILEGDDEHNWPSKAEDDEHVELFEKFLTKVTERFERETGLHRTAIAWRWRLITGVNAAIGLAVVALVYATMSKGAFDNPGLFQRIMRFGGWAIGIIVGLIGMTIGAALMPLEFFEQHSAGRRFRDFVGKDDPKDVQRALRYGAVFIIAVFAFMAYYAHATFH